MRREQRFCAEGTLVRHMLEHRAGDAHAVERRGAAPDLVKDQQAAARGVFQNIRNLGHLYHKGGLPGGHVVRRADAGEDRVYHTDFRRLRGYKAADLRHQHDQRDLAHIGGFTGHVRAGDDRDAVFLLIELHIVRHKGRAVEHLFHHGVAALFQNDFSAEVHLGALVAVRHRHRRERGENIELRHGGGRSLHPLELRRRLGPHLLKQLGFELHGFFMCAQNTALKLFQIGRDEALAVRQSLLSYVLVGHLVAVRVGNLDIITEYPVVTYFEFWNSRFLALLRFELGNDFFAAAHIGSQLVELFMVAGADHAALADGKRGLVDDGAFDEGRHILERVDLFPDFFQQSRGNAAQQLF